MKRVQLQTFFVHLGPEVEASTLLVWRAMSHLSAEYGSPTTALVVVQEEERKRRKIFFF